MTLGTIFTTDSILEPLYLNMDIRISLSGVLTKTSRARVQFLFISYFLVSSMESILQSPKSLLTRRTSRSKSIPPALVINPNPSSMEIDSKGKDVGVKKDQASKLRQLAEFATSPRSLYNHSPLTSLTPSLLGTDGSGVEWGLKSPSKFSFSDKSVRIFYFYILNLNTFLLTV